MIQLDNITYTYPFHGQPALENVSLKIEPGETVLVTGPSGGGKSTLLRLLNGLIPHIYHGSVDGRYYLEGVDTADLSLRDISRSVSTLFQDPHKQFLALNVQDEIAFAIEWREPDPRVILRKTEQALYAFGLNDLRSASIYELSDGQKQKVALASLVVLSPKILVLDEPAANLDEKASIELANELARLKAEGITIVIADHKLSWLRNLIDRVIVIERGRISVEGDETLLFDSELRTNLGLRSIDYPDSNTSNLAACKSGNNMIRWEDLTFAYRGQPLLFENANLEIPYNSVTALTGPNGSGKTTFAKLMAGLLKPKRGTLYIHDCLSSPRGLLSMAGMAMQNSELQLYQKQASIEVSCAAAGRGPVLSRKDSLAWLDRFGLREFADSHPQSLSGGQKQRLVVACAAARAGELLILDEPTSGLDGSQMRALADLLDERRSRNKSTLVITHDQELVARVCDSEIQFPLTSTQESAVAAIESGRES